MKTVHSRNRTYVSPTATRQAGFRPGQRVAVERTASNTVTIKSFNKVRKDMRVATYTVEPTGAIRMSSTKIGRRAGATTPTTTTGSRSVKLTF